MAELDIAVGGDTILLTDSTEAEDDSILFVEGTVLVMDGTVTSADGTISFADGTISFADGTVLFAEGTTSFAVGTTLIVAVVFTFLATVVAVAFGIEDVDNTNCIDGTKGACAGTVGTATVGRSGFHIVDVGTVNVEATDEGPVDEAADEAATEVADEAADEADDVGMVDEAAILEAGVGTKLIDGIKDDENENTDGKDEDGGIDGLDRDDESKGSFVDS
ncbi:hypothetical protein EV360DRAFT_65530 [Lentinula raphanica]|nr:hypothetical protein EV360DRAFT_65530 [Lentinula raphanica]